MSSSHPEIASARSGRLLQVVILTGTLMLFWLMLMGSASIDILFVGLVAAVSVAFLFRNGLSFFTEFQATPEAFVAGLLYYGYFFRELVRSNLRLATIVMSPGLPINPGIVKVRTSLKSRMGRLMLANSITLTPGTLTVELEDEWLYVHWVVMESADVEEATRRIVSGWERYLKVIYG